MPFHGADGDQRVRIPQPAAARDAVREPEAVRHVVPHAVRRDAARWDARRTRHLRLRLADPARRAEARRLLTLVLDVPPLPGADPAVLVAEVPDGRRAVDVLIELAWARIELDGFGLDAAA
ncbi:hypothetical protein O7599_32075 [Streptomyces sp. WMMC500]|uniref:hypothetical protein n=1 Tax=Streptomyces sp. WMMC500 TaxID=3015154 RepID=UPI00248A92F7|nr:hypothetical protein [Streptomyces sp. WMMC500]WBB60125.1 hypothetical protein O7599_32075 [Streptomyces sp. WMMC500]